MDLGSGHESNNNQQQVQPHPLPISPLPAPMMLPSLVASNYHSTPPSLYQQLHHHQHALHHDLASTTKLKLQNQNNTPSGNGGSLPSKNNDVKTSDQVATDQAREILRQAVVTAVTESNAATAKAANAKKGAVRYRECQKNHAAGIGAHAIDGCGEFMPGGEEGSVDALRCAACNCHRNFHRREVEGEVLCDCKRKPKPGVQLGAGIVTPGMPTTLTSATPVSTLALTVGGAGQMSPLAMAALSAGGPTDSDEQDDGPGNVTSGGGMMMSMRSPSAIKKRFRTKFTTEQKDKMFAFAEKLGWRIQKHDEAAVQEFCALVGVKRHVLKVWMHNNKHTMGKKP